MKPAKRILVAPMDWGLGHAARCVPVINELQRRGCEVLLASADDALLFLKSEFPALQTFELPAYRPQYPADGDMVTEMGKQIPHFKQVLADEQKATEEIVKQQKVDVIISDNRYGCHSAAARSYIIAHQLHILLPRSVWFAEPLVNGYNHKMLREFDKIYCPVFPESENTFYPTKLMKGASKLQVGYLGMLSRFEKMGVERKYDIAVICSGPEPQRTMFEELVTSDLKKTSLKAIVLRGKPGDTTLRSDGNITVVDHLHTANLNRVILESDLIISRSGYSTVMDLAKLQKRAIFVPTPGQTEQEYIGKELMEQEIAYCVKQDKFNLEKALNEAKSYRGFANFEWDDEMLRNAVGEMLGG